MTPLQTWYVKKLRKLLTTNHFSSQSRTKVGSKRVSLCETHFASFVYLGCDPHPAECLFLCPEKQDFFLLFRDFDLFLCLLFPQLQNLTNLLTQDHFVCEAGPLLLVWLCFSKHPMMSDLILLFQSLLPTSLASHMHPMHLGHFPICHAAPCDCQKLKCFLFPLVAFFCKGQAQCSAWTQN